MLGSHRHENTGVSSSHHRVGMERAIAEYSAGKTARAANYDAYTEIRTDTKEARPSHKQKRVGRPFALASLGAMMAWATFANGCRSVALEKTSQDIPRRLDQNGFLHGTAMAMVPRDF